MSDIPKHIKRLLREQAALAYEVELRRALAPLAAAFDQWKEGKVSSDMINDMIHEFHQGPHRDLYSRYNSKMYEPTIAYAIVKGILDKEKVPRELLEHLARLIKLYEEDLKRE
jgi:hypothetical protein